MEQQARRPIVLQPGKGRSYRMGGMAAIFKADEVETPPNGQVCSTSLLPPGSSRTWP